MMQSFNTQLQVSLRALREVVAPALQNGEKHVVEQLHLALATLEFTKQRLPYARRYHRLELKNYLGFAAKVRGVINDQLKLCEQLAAAEGAGKGELLNPEAELEDYVLVTRQLRELIAATIPLSINKPYENELDMLVVRSQQQFLLQQRAWCTPFGFELKPDELPQLDQMLGTGDSGG